MANFLGTPRRYSALPATSRMALSARLVSTLLGCLHRVGGRRRDLLLDLRLVVLQAAQQHVLADGDVGLLVVDLEDDERLLLLPVDALHAVVVAHVHRRDAVAVLLHRPPLLV